MKDISAVIVAAGASSRMKADVNKVFMKLGNKTVIRNTLEVFENTSCINEIILVTREEDIDKAEIEAKGITKLKKIVKGGAERQISVANGVKEAKCKMIAIHDGARPLVTSEEIVKVCLDAEIYGAATLCTKVKDTVKVSDENGFVVSTPLRSTLRAIATPQVFIREEYLEALSKAESENKLFTDDCQLIENNGGKVYLTEGEYTNIKITTPEDIGISNALKGKRGENIMRIGHGYDVHKLVEGRKCIIGGVDIPFELGLLGHSDADVLLHAIADSLLGAAALGDIGKHFPDTDQKFKGADSMVLLSEVVSLIENKGYKVNNIDATVIAQKPKLLPHINKMRENIASCLKTDIDNVNVKATTEEKLGFTGRLEGISAHCVAIITKR
ncbi:MAG: 2-C-methyl-D-erythritol 2,4-cyclodiphosphate synthase [Ruminococcaceae bacterium]|nr:2-C-methyl-D-erythritol 2,4-cyclodiphosphate synthase [Oscillospiraceae bacterium]